MNSWKIRVISLILLLLVLLILDVKIRHYSTVIYEGQLPIVVCLGRVEKLDTNEQIDQILTIFITSGPFRGSEVVAENIFTGKAYGDRILHKGDRLFLEIPIKKGRVEVHKRFLGLSEKYVVSGQIELDDVSVGEYFRSRFLLHLLGGFACLLVVIGSAKGLRAIAALFASGGTMLFIFLPLLLKGYPPLWVALFISTLATIVTFLIIGGISKKVVSGTLGTLGGLASCALLISLTSVVLHFTGLDVEFGHMQLGKRLWWLKAEEELLGTGAHWNYSGLLAAGIVVGALGAMMDVCMAISSSVEEVKKANPNISVRDAIKSGLNVGRDIIGTMANTLIFAYIGADMTLMVLPGLNIPMAGYRYPFFLLLNQEAPAVESVQALIGTIGLVLAVPITALIAGMLVGGKNGSS